MVVVFVWDALPFSMDHAISGFVLIESENWYTLYKGIL